MNQSVSSGSIHPDQQQHCPPSSVAHIYVNNADMANDHYHRQSLGEQQMQMHVNHSAAMPQVVHHNPVNLTMSVHSITPSPHVMSPTIMSPSVIETSPGVRVISPLPQSQQQIPPNTSTFQPNNAVFFQSFTPKGGEHAQLAHNAHQFRLQHTHSLQHNYNIQPNNAQPQKMVSHQHSLPERAMFATSTGSAVAYANAHLLTSIKSPNHPPVAQISVNPLNNHPHHTHHHHDVAHRNSHPQTSQQYTAHPHDSNKPPIHKAKHSGSRTNLATAGVGPGSTQTLPHPKSQGSRSNHAIVNINTATLGRKTTSFIVSWVTLVGYRLGKLTSLFLKLSYDLSYRDFGTETKKMYVGRYFML